MNGLCGTEINLQGKLEKERGVFMKRTAKLIALLLALSMLLCACSGGTTADSSAASAASDSTAVSSTASEAASGGEVGVKEDPDTIVFGFDSEPGKLDPQNNAQLGGMAVEKQVYDPLINKDPETGEFLPGLATAWEWVDDTHLKLTLREGVKFHNGQDFTAADVVYTVGRFPTGSSTGSLYAAFDPENTVANGDYEVTIAFYYPFSPALNFLTNGRAYIVPHEYMEENGEQALNQVMIGTGPFKFVEWVVGSHCTMERNDEYWGGAPAFKNLTVRFIADNSARMIALETGELDLALGIQDSDIKILLNGEREHINGLLVPGMQVNYFAFNMNVEPLADVRVRQALAHAVDWAAAVETAGGVVFQLADSCIAPTVEYYTPIGVYEYDVELAKELLAEAGYADGFTINAINEEIPAAVRLLEIMQQYFAEVGVTMNIQVVDNATWIESNNNGTSDVSICNMTASTGDPAHTLNSTRGVTVTGKIDDPEYVELYDAGMSAMDATERGEIYAELQQYVYDNVLQIPLFVRVISYGYWDYLDGFYPAPDQMVDFRTISVKQ